MLAIKEVALPLKQMAIRNNLYYIVGRRRTARLPLLTWIY